VLLGWPVVLFPLHIAFLELVIDPACSMVFENEPSEADVMQRAPRDVNTPLFAGMTLVLALLQGLGVLMAVMGAYAWGASWLTETAARAFAFTTLVMGNLALIFSNRSSRGSLWVSLRVPNRTLWIVTGVTLGLLGLALYLPWLSRLFFFSPLSAPDLLTATGLGLLSVLWFETIKLARRLSRGTGTLVV
jgi:Ca2+-transporting ATPase